LSTASERNPLGDGLVALGLIVQEFQSGGKVMEESDAVRVAAEMVRLHGQAAEMIAADACDRALELEDEGGFSDWMRVAALIARSLRQAVPREIAIEIPDTDHTRHAA
jgi:hypothetical protein